MFGATQHQSVAALGWENGAISSPAQTEGHLDSGKEVVEQNRLRAVAA